MIFDKIALKALLADNQLNFTMFAQKAGISMSTLKRVVAGQNPSRATFELLIDAISKLANPHKIEVFEDKDAGILLRIRRAP